MKLYHDINLGVLRNIPVGVKKILDVGCSTGTFGEILKSRGYIVYGIDISKEAVEIARGKLDRAEVCDLQNDELPFEEEFDVIIFADVLEHVIYPGNMLENAKKYLAPGGFIIASLPNVAVWFMRLRLLFGNFSYAESGILDNTHLKFYTLKTAKQLFIEKGYDILKIDITPGFARLFVPYIRKIKGTDAQLLDSSSYKWYAKYIYPAEHFFSKIRKQLFAYQFVMICKPK